MARVRRPAIRRRTVAGEYIVRRAEAAKRADPSRTYKEIAREFGMNERTLRKLRTGETSGRQVFRKGVTPPVRKVGPPKGGAPQLLVVHYQWWYVQPDGSAGYRHWSTTNIIMAAQMRNGRPRIPFTQFDVFTLADDPRIADAVERDIARKMASAHRAREGSAPLAGSAYGYRIDTVKRAAIQRAAPIEIMGRLVR